MNKIDFNELTNLDIPHKEGIVMVVLGHDRCGYCPYAKQAINKIGKDLGLPTYYCDTIENPKVIQWFTVTSVPMVMFIKQGIVVRTINGAKTEKEYLTILNEIGG